jgi:hypothetical protein
MSRMRLLFWLLTLPVVLKAQLTQPYRFELVQKAADFDFTVISLDKEGLALFRETDIYKDGKHSWQLIVLDTTLIQVVDTLITVERNFNIIGYEYVPGKVELLFREGEFANSKMLLSSFNLKSREIRNIEIKTELDIKLTHFSSIGENVLLGGYISNEPAILMYESVKSNVIVLPGFFQRNTELMDLRVNQNNTFNVVMVEKTSSESKRILFRTFDAQGKILLEDNVAIDEKRNIQSAISSSLYREDLLLMGTWGSRNANRSYGFYSFMINPFEEQKPAFKAFGELSHYLDYLKPKRAQKIKNKTKEAIANDKFYDYTNNVIPYKIIEFENGFIVLAETYSPVSFSTTNTYNSPNSPYWNSPYYYNNPYYYSYPTSRLYRPRTFGENVANEEEIKTYSSALLWFNTNGELANDFSMKIEDVKIRSVEQVTDAGYYNGEAIIVYRKDSKLFYKKMNAASEEVVEGNEPIKLNDSLDELREEEDSDGGIRQWFGNSFYTWGYQTIRNINVKGDKTREVFYVNKIMVR